MERRGVCPSTDGKKHLEMTMLLLEKVDRLEISIEVLAFIVPRVTGVVDILVGPQIGEEDFAGIGFDVCKGIEDMAVRL
jgi:hypothetical protein